ncbi:CbtA family protein [Fodinicurvata sediminis]|uniref:CbtA family protein n=1 Tax=Fodinicurvata sediminis TaxID=1121832 RepID=UPI0003B3E3EA|nr:CbtA family protein [Fodinicurvata sediminis]
MLSRILITGLVAGSIAGLAITVLQLATLMPLLHQAELYEAGFGANETLSMHDNILHDRDQAGVFGKSLLTLLSNGMTGIGFGLVIAAGMSLLGRTRAWHGLLWGTGGFLAWSLLPAIGVPPALPGVEQAPLFERQSWFLVTALSSSAGLLALFLLRPHWLKPVGLILLALPHLYGAPVVPTAQSGIPPELSEQFLLASLSTSAAFWLVLGIISSSIFRTLVRNPQAEMVCEPG